MNFRLMCLGALGLSLMSTSGTIEQSRRPSGRRMCERWGQTFCDYESFYEPSRLACIMRYRTTNETSSCRGFTESCPPHSVIVENRKRKHVCVPVVAAHQEASRIFGVRLLGETLTIYEQKVSSSSSKKHILLHNVKINYIFCSLDEQKVFVSSRRNCSIYIWSPDERRTNVRQIIVRQPVGKIAVDSKRRLLFGTLRHGIAVVNTTTEKFKQVSRLTLSYGQLSIDPKHSRLFIIYGTQIVSLRYDGKNKKSLGAIGSSYLLTCDPETETLYMANTNVLKQMSMWGGESSLVTSLIVQPKWLWASQGVVYLSNRRQLLAMDAGTGGTLWSKNPLPTPLEGNFCLMR